MPTTFYPRSASMSVGTYGNGTMGAALMDRRGSAATSVSDTTVASGTWITLANFATPPLQAFTFSGAISCNLRGLESNAQANASLGVRFYRWTRSDFDIGGLLVQASATVELTTAEGVVTATATAPGTAFSAGDVLVAQVGIINIGSMGGNRTVTLFYDGPTAGASGDTYITINPTVAAQRRVFITE